MTDEKWRTVEDFPDYEVSNRGQVRSLKRYPARILKPWLHASGGYPAVKLSVTGEKQQTKLVHQLVCYAFHGPKPTPKHEVAHWDGNPQNCATTNIRWALPVENSADKRRHGTHINSGQFEASKLTDDDIREIRRLAAEGWTQSRIGEKFGVWQTYVSHIVTGRRKKEVT